MGAWNTAHLFLLSPFDVDVAIKRPWAFRQPIIMLDSGSGLELESEREWEWERSRFNLDQSVLLASATRM